MDTKNTTAKLVDEAWEKEAIPVLSDYIKIENMSPAFDKNWESNGLIQKATDLLYAWAAKQDIKGMKHEIIKLEKKTPIIFITIEPTSPDFKSTILMYGHLDKQPPMTDTWDKGLHPYQPVIKDGKLYGRGGADDGYAIFAALISVQTLQKQGIPHGRIVVLIEASEESGSIHLPDYVSHLQTRIGTPDLIVCLDSGCGNYEQFWLTTSLRGVLNGDLVVKVLSEGVHSGKGSGIIPSSFRIVRMLLDRIEDVNTGMIKVKDLFVDVPPSVMKQIGQSATGMGTETYLEFPFVEGAGPVDKNDMSKLILQRTWHPTLSVTGADGLPPLAIAGNVVRTHTSFKLSFRLPPTANAEKCAAALEKELNRDPPYGANVCFKVEKAAGGFAAPELEPWLEEAVHKASNSFFGKPANYIGEGGTIPFMGMLQEKFPKAQFVITGLLGPRSNAHGPNEFLHISCGKNVTSCVASIVADHYAKFK